MLRTLEKRLVNAAREVAESLPTGDIHTVAAAAMDTTGTISTGVNVFHFTGGPCAEMTAIAAAAEANAGPLVAMVAVGDRTRGVISPCGRCRQFMLDLHPDISVIVPFENDLIIEPIHRLLPFSYRATSYTTGPRVVRFASRYYDSVAAGDKTVTVRRDEPVQAGPTTFVFDDGEWLWNLDGVIDTVRSIRAAQLTLEDARRENLPDVASLRARLLDHYPDLSDDDLVQVAGFHVTS